MAKLLKLQVDRPCLIPPGPLAAATRDPPFVNPGAELIPHGTQDLRKLGYLDSKQSIHSQPGRERGHWGPWLTASSGSACLAGGSGRKAQPTAQLLGPRSPPGDKAVNHDAQWSARRAGSYRPGHTCAPAGARDRSSLRKRDSPQSAGRKWSARTGSGGRHRRSCDVL